VIFVHKSNHKQAFVNKRYQKDLLLMYLERQ